MQKVGKKGACARNQKGVHVLIVAYACGGWGRNFGINGIAYGGVRQIPYNFSKEHMASIW
jgi:hypothetical protein